MLGSKEERSDRYSYLDSLTTVLTEYEKNLYNLIERLNKAADKLSRIERQEPKTYIKSRQVDSEDHLKSLLQAAQDILQS